MKNSTKNKKPNKIKRIIAALGAFLLFIMYASTLFFALTDHSAAQGLLKASVACTIILPVLLYAYMLVYRLAAGTHNEEKDPKEDSESSRGKS